MLERAAEDIDFFSQLSQDYSTALKEYELAPEEQAALASGDVRWIESHIGKKLDEQLMTKAMIPLLSREKW